MLVVPTAHRVAVMVCIKVISVMIVADFFALVVTVVVTPNALSERMAAAQREYGRNGHA